MAGKCLGTDAGNISGTAKFDDPCMGDACSCNLIAALSSIAWVYWPAIRSTLKPRFAGLSQEIIIKAFQMRDDGAWKNTHPGPGKTCMWPAIYEKAYAYDATNYVSDPVKGLDPLCDVSILGPDKWPSPIDALIRVANGPGDQTWYSTPILTSTSPVAPTLNTGRNGSPLLNQQRITVPAVAWTKSLNGLPMGSAIGDDEMVSEHCYSILGVKKIDAANYIVLRNPWGRSTGGNATNLAPDGAWYEPANKDHYAYLNNVPQPDKQTGVTVPLNRKNGIFGLKNSEFFKYFYGWGYVY